MIWLYGAVRAFRSKKEKQMNDNTQNNTGINLDTLPEGAANIRIIEGNDTDGETNVIHVTPEGEDHPVDVSVADTVH